MGTMPKLCLPTTRGAAYAAALSLGMAATLSPAAFAQSAAKAKAMVELYTSQGCSSCPPADAYLRKLAKRDDLIALSFSVDYWDHIGWKDTLARPKNAKRQYAYAKRKPGGDNRVYTPQMIINGIACAVGSHEAKVEAEIARTMAQLDAARVAISARLDNGAIEIETGAATHEAHASGSIWVAAVTKAVDVAIQRGENEGRKITYANVVRDFTTVASWSGTADRYRLPLDKLDASDADFYVVVLQSSANGAVLAAVDVGR